MAAGRGSLALALGSHCVVDLGQDARQDSGGLAVNEEATFLASFPAIQSAIKIHGSGDGMRVQLDIPESEMAEAVKLLQWREVVLRVSMGPWYGERPTESTGIHI